MPLLQKKVNLVEAGSKSFFMDDTTQSSSHIQSMYTTYTVVPRLSQGLRSNDNLRSVKSTK